MAPLSTNPGTDAPTQILPNRSHLPGGDNVRTIAMVAVFTVHILSTLHNQQPRWLEEYCRLGTDLFMLLSGALIYQSIITSPQTYGAFLGRRARRIVPVFLCVLALYVVILFPLFPSLSKLPTQSLPAILIVIGNMMIVPMAFGVPPVITVSWTLGYICVFYVAGYPLARITQKLPFRLRMLVWSALTAVVFLLIGRAALLPGGVMLAELMRCHTAPRWLFLGWTATFLRCVPMESHLQLVCAGGAAVTICWWMLQRSCVTAVTRAFSRISYSFYLTHGLTLLGVAELHLPLMYSVPLGIIAALGSSTLLYLAVERRFSPSLRESLDGDSLPAVCSQGRPEFSTRFTREGDSASVFAPERR